MKQLNVRRDHHCFGCGHLNPNGLKLEFWIDDESGDVSTSWTPSQVHQGYGGIVHGGIISTVLDEVMGWELSSKGIWAVTAKLNVQFRKPVEVGVATTATARIASDQGRKVDLEAVLMRASDLRPLATASGLFIRVPPEKAMEWENRYLPDQGE
jgi:acyl-coenzyme A thioesterase PaaI-like protein